ncbi:MAG: hypothetical protein AB8C84_09945 [Oligoflexales bacterium]
MTQKSKVNSHDKLFLLYSYILIYLIREYGYEQLQKQRAPKNKIILPPLSTFSEKIKVSHDVRRHLIDNLVQNDCIVRENSKISITKPNRFLRHYQKQLVKKLSKPTAYMLPKNLMSIPLLKKAKYFDNTLSELSKNGFAACFLFHSAYYGYKKIDYVINSKMIQNDLPLCVLADRETVNLMKQKLGLKEIALKEINAENSKKPAIPFPRDLSIPGLLVHEANNINGFINTLSQTKDSNIGSLIPELNTLALSMFPIRGVESSERLSSLIDRYWLEIDSLDEKLKLPQFSQ